MEKTGRRRRRPGVAGLVFEWIVDIFLRLVLLVLIWAMMSAQGTLVSWMKWEWGAQAWNYVFNGDMGRDLFARSAESTMFPVGCYEKYIRCVNEANLPQGTAIFPACAVGDQLYYAVNGEVFRVSAENTDKVKYLGQSLVTGPFVGSKRCLVSVDTSGVRYIRIPQAKRNCLLYGKDWLSELEPLGFPALADRLYELLQAQETRELTSREFAVLACYASKGILLDYEEGTAWLADDRSAPGTVTLYRQDGPGSRTECYHYEDAYTGTGAGRFMVDGLFICVPAQGLTAWLTNDGWSTAVPEWHFGFPAKALNFRRDEQGTLQFSYVDRENNIVQVPWELSEDGAWDPQAWYRKAFVNEKEIQDPDCFCMYTADHTTFTYYGKQNNMGEWLMYWRRS